MPPIKNPLALLVFGLAALFFLTLFILTSSFISLGMCALMILFALFSNSDFI